MLRYGASTPRVMMYSLGPYMLGNGVVAGIIMGTYKKQREGEQEEFSN